jgi:hypothetical protein
MEIINQHNQKLLKMKNSSFDTSRDSNDKGHETDRRKSVYSSIKGALGVNTSRLNVIAPQSSADNYVLHKIEEGLHKVGERQNHVNKIDELNNDINGDDESLYYKNDDGTSVITAEDYVRVRLNPVLLEFIAMAKPISTIKNVILFLVLILSVASSILSGFGYEVFIPAGLFVYIIVQHVHKMPKLRLPFLYFF